MIRSASRIRRWVRSSKSGIGDLPITRIWSCRFRIEWRPDSICKPPIDWAKDLTNAGGDAPTAFGIEQGNVSGPNGLTGINDRFNLRLDRGNDPGVRRDRFLLTAQYQLPFGRGMKFLSHSSRAVDAVLGRMATQHDHAG